MLKYFRGN